MVKKINEEMAATEHSNAVQDFDSSNRQTTTFTRQDFESAPEKVSKRIKPLKPERDK